MHRKTRTGALAAVVLLGLVTAACGSDKKESGATTTAGGGATTTAGSGGATTTAAAGPTTTAASSELLKYDESAKCGTPEYAGNLAKLEAVDAKTVKFTFCKPDVAFPRRWRSRRSRSAVGVPRVDQRQRRPPREADRHRPLQAQQWDRGSQIVLRRQPRLLGRRAQAKTLVFQWSTEAAQRLVQLQSGAADGIDNVGTDDFDTVKGDANLQLVERDRH